MNRLTVLVSLTLFASTLASCSSNQLRVVDGGLLTDEGWPWRDTERRFRCPIGTDLVDVIAPSGRRTVACQTPATEQPRGFEASWSADRSFVSLVRYDDRGRPLEATRWFPSGEKRSEESFREGRLVDRVAWYRTGVKKERLHYEPGEGITRVTRWQPDGEIEAEGILDQGRKTGQWKEWRDGALAELTYVAGKPQGPVRRVYPGESVEEGTYSEGKRVGAWVRYDDRGRKTRLVGYDKGVRHGEYRLWHPNEQKRLRGSFNRGEKHGEWVTWYPTGEKRSQGHYACGEKVGWWKAWHPNGEKKSLGFYHQGEKVGEWREWTEGGIVATVRSFSVPEELAQSETFEMPELPETCEAPEAEQ